MKKDVTNILTFGALPVLAISLASCGGGGEGGGGASAGSNTPTGAPAAGEITLDAGAIGFPKPQFVGTPVPPGNLPNLEKPGEPKTSVNVAEGSTLLSVGKPVTASDDLPVIGELSYITDGDKEGGDGYYVELGPDPQWVQIDLEAEATIEAIIVWHFHKQERVYKDVVIQVSNDPEFATSTTVYNSDHDNSAGLGEGSDKVYVETNHGRIIDTNGLAGRYVRLYSNGNTSDDLNHYVEVAVYGKAGGA